jgi:non-specific serine/threonine protein kinase
VQGCVARAPAVAPSFALTEANTPVVAEICRRLDGIPLAIELAAPRVRALSVAQIAARLGDRFGLLTAGSRTALPRHQTLRALVDWSYDLLPADQQWLFAQLSVFAGGFTLEAAEAVVGPVPPVTSAAPAAVRSTTPKPAQDVLDGLAQLVDKSLVMAEVRDGADDGVRYRLLETLREYAAERLAGHWVPSEAAGAHERHAAYFLALAEDSRMPLLRAEQLDWLARLDREHDNMRAALRWWLERGQTGDDEAVERGLQLAGALGWPYWSLRAHHTEGREWLEGLLVLPSAGPTLGRARALLALGQLSLTSPDWHALAAWFTESEALGRAHGDTWTAACALMFHGSVLARGSMTGSAPPMTGREHLEEALTLFQGLGDLWGVGECLRYVGWLLHVAGDLDGAQQAYTRSLEAAQAAGERWAMAVALRGLGEVALARGDPALARRQVEQALALTQELGVARGSAVSLLVLAEIAEAVGAPGEALAHCREAATLLRPYNILGYKGLMLARCANAALALGDPQRAVHLAGAAVTWFQTLGRPVPAGTRAWVERVRAAGRQALSQAAFDAAWARGCAMAVDEAIDDILAAGVGPYTTKAVPEPGVLPAAAAGAVEKRWEPLTAGDGDRLSARERQVAVLVARGYSNPQIATALTVTRATAARHVEHILAKLGLRNRAQITAWAVEHGLLVAGRD